MEGDRDSKEDGDGEGEWDGEGDGDGEGNGEMGGRRGDGETEIAERMEKERLGNLKWVFPAPLY